MNLKSIWHKHQIIISIVILVVSAYMFVLGLFGVVLKDYSPQAIIDMSSVFGNWIYWFLVIGGFFMIVFTWYLIDRYRKIKEFKELIDTKSKSKFIKNIARIETLALSLGPEYEEEVMEIEEEYNIDR